MGPDAMSSASGASMLRNAFPTEATLTSLTDWWGLGPGQRPRVRNGL